MNELHTSYLRLESDEDEQAYLVHAAEGNKGRWHHIEDLDLFFTRVYQYHQNHGFACTMLQQFFELVQFVFVIGFATFLLSCVDYNVLFANGNLTYHEDMKVTITDAIYSSPVCNKRIGQNAALVMCLLIASCFWLIRLARVVYNFFRLNEIKEFYTQALHIKPTELDNLTWHEVQRRLMLVQQSQQMCIHKQELTELDIYNRILRFKNFMIAMVNKDVLPISHHLPFLGNTVFLTQGLKYNIELILFWGPKALFANNYNLKDEYKRKSNREKLAAQLSRHILWVAAINLILSPVILVWQVLYSFFSYAEILKREPGSFGARRWSLYARIYLRHFNELSHEFQARLSRGYRPATKYMEAFNDPIFTVVAKNITFFVGSVLAVLLVLTVWDEDVLRVEHVLTLITICTIVITICKSFIPDENVVSCPELLMKKVLAQVHYVPESWRGRAHTHQVREQFAQLFQYKIVYIVEELLSPLITPLVLMFSIRNKSLQIVDFFHNFTVDIAGVGDVCSFAQMDIRRHGDPKWQVSDTNPGEDHAKVKQSSTSPTSKAAHGKTELSLMHFAITNPLWTPKQDESQFLEQIKGRAHNDAVNMTQSNATNPLLSSLNSLGALTMPPVNFLQQNSMLMSGVRQQQSAHPQDSMLKSQNNRLSGSLNNQETPLQYAGGGIMNSVMAGQQGFPANHDMSESIRTTTFALEQNINEIGPLEMSLSALYMHELHQNKTVNETTDIRWEPIVEEDINRGSNERPTHSAADHDESNFMSVLLHTNEGYQSNVQSVVVEPHTASTFDNDVASDSDEAPQVFHLPESQSNQDSLPPINFTFQNTNNSDTHDKF